MAGHFSAEHVAHESRPPAALRAAGPGRPGSAQSQPPSSSFCLRLFPVRLSGLLPSPVDV